MAPAPTIEIEAPLTKEETDELERIACKTNLEYLCTQLLGCELWDSCHYDLARWLQQSTKNFKLILMPRECLKTTIITIGRGIQYILQDPNISIAYISHIHANAVRTLRQTSDFLTTKSRLPQLWGDFKSSKWNETEIIINQRKSADRSPTIMAAGVDTALTSQHPDVIFLDDIVDDLTVSTADQIEKTLEFFRRIFDLLKKPDGKLYVIGTRWSDADLYGTIIEQYSDLFDIYDVGITKNREIDGEIIFPKKFPNTDYLKMLLKLKGSYQFNCQFMNRPISKESQHFKPPVRYWHELPPEAMHVITVDLAISEKTEADYTVVMHCAKANGILYVVEYSREHMTPNQTIEKIFDFVTKCGGQPKVGVEAIAYQRALIHLIEDEKKKRKMTFQVEAIRPHRDKFSRVLALQPLWESGNLLLKQGMVELEDELARFPVSKHDDCIDALAMQLVMPDGIMVKNTYRHWIPERFRRRLVAA